MAGAKKPEPIEIVGSDGKIYVVETWNRGTIADGDAMTEYTIKPICEAIQGGTGSLSAETERAMSAERGISAIVDNHYDEYNTFVSSVNSSAESLNAKDDDLQDQIDTLKAATDVIMVYNNYSAFSSNSGNLFLTDNDVIKVLNDSERQEKQTYYQYSTATSAWTFIGELDPYYSKTELNTAAGKNINISTITSGIKISTKNDVTFSSVSALNFYIPSANDGALSISEISSNSTGISAHLVSPSPVQDEIVTASWESIINAANNENAYVPLSAETCTIGTDNSAYEISLAQGVNNNAEYTSLAQGSNNSAYSVSLAQGYKNVASGFSFAQGYFNSASNYSFAFGRNSQANQGGFAFSPFLSITSVPSFASANSFAFGNGCTADTNAFAMGVNCSAVTGGFAYGTDCSAATNSIAMGVGMVSIEKQISLGNYGILPTSSSDVVFHVGYGTGSAGTARRDVFNITSAGTIASYDASVYPRKAEVSLNSEFFEAPRKFGRKIPMLLSRGLNMATDVNVNVSSVANFSARHNVIYGDESTGCFNMWIPNTTASQEFTLTKAESLSNGLYRLTIGVDGHYSIIFKNFAPVSSTLNHTSKILIKTGLDVSGSWPTGGTQYYYGFPGFYKSSATTNTYFDFQAIPCDDIITFIVDGFSKQFIMIKGH